MIYTSLNEIRSYTPCIEGWRNILAGQKKTVSDDVLFPLTEAIESNTVSDICWLIYKRQKQNELAAMAKFAKMCADSVAPLNNFWSRRTATYAADSAASAAASAATYAAGYAAASAFADQKAKNKQFLITCITECE